MKPSPLGLHVVPGLSLSAHRSVMGLCIRSHLQQEKASLMSETLIHGYNRMPLGVILSLCSLSRMIVFGFPLGSWAMLYQVLGHLNNVRHEFYLMEWALTTTR